MYNEHCYKTNKNTSIIQRAISRAQEQKIQQQNQSTGYGNRDNKTHEWTRLKYGLGFWTDQTSGQR